jgi:hypothetical protein
MGKMGGKAMGNRNYKRPFCLDRKVPKPLLKGQSFFSSGTPSSLKQKTPQPLPAKKVHP